MQRLTIPFIAALLIQRVLFADAVQATFEFHNGFWVNLHHTLYNQAAGKKSGRVPKLPALNAAETTAWSEALDYYEQNLASRLPATPLA